MLEVLLIMYRNSQSPGLKNLWVFLCDFCYFEQQTSNKKDTIPKRKDVS